ncbi:hypothetical protein [Pseudomonas aeruginosa]|nr:hypothetical protein [Pseudomonas aeruginosa]
MPTNIRLTQAEQEALRKKAVEINKKFMLIPYPSFFAEKGRDP